ncbi:hypothetical protein RND71_021252 [Anisodus tanguticus]|uniref:Uncharacterized protein n=1 Tax=Anisodus tanguticus TaxID=243964 RepID=A0AAE1RW73_9SOLA|nr:hypothetical protein RND71_021252 [Anisodus tanguticus]
MDETGEHSRLNVKKPLLYRYRGTASPVQTVAGKDKTNPLKVVTLLKSETEEETPLKTRRKLPRTITGSTSRARSRVIRPQSNIEQIIKDTLESIFKKRQDKHENPVAPEINSGIISGQNNEDIDHVSETSSENENELIQEGQDPNEDDDSDHVSETSSENENELIQEGQDPNEDDDSGMSFDSIALHNLDT